MQTVFYDKVDLDLVEDLQRLNKFKDREYGGKYTTIECMYEMVSFKDKLNSNY